VGGLFARDAFAAPKAKVPDRLADLGVKPFINAAGTYVYVASYDPARNSGNAVSVISTATNTAVATVNLPSNDLSHPCGIAVNPTGTKVFVA